VYNDLVREYWHNPETGETAMLLEAEPGIVHVTTELMHELILRLGFTEKVNNR